MLNVAPRLEPNQISALNTALQTVLEDPNQAGEFFKDPKTHLKDLHLSDADVDAIRKYFEYIANKMLSIALTW